MIDGLVKNRNKEKSYINISIIVFMSLVILFRLGLAMLLPYNGIANAGFDDAWLVRAAEQISAGNWLGDYNYLTMIKGISFPIFLVISKVLCIPYGMLLVLLYILAAAVLLLAMRNQLTNPYVRCLVFIWIIYSPISFSASTGMRIYRNSILFPAVLLVIATVVGMLKAKGKTMREYTIWSIGVGLSFSFFYYIREDSIWLVPFVSVVLGYVLVLVFLEKLPVKKKVGKIIITFVPVMILIFVTFVYSGLNYKKYGVFMTNDRTQGAFSDVVGAMLQVQTGECAPDVWIPRDTMEQIVEECPTLEANHYDYMFMYDAWAEGKGDASGDYYAWALRQTIGKLGYDESAIKMQEYCNKIAEEIDLALEEGRLKRDDKIHFSGQTKGISKEQCVSLIKESLDKMIKVSLYQDDFDAKVVNVGNGTREQYRYLEAMTGVQVAYPQENYLDLRGWIYLKNPEEQISLDLVDEAGNVLVHGISLYESKNVARYTGDENAAMAQFLMELKQVNWIEYAYLAVYRDGKLYKILPMENYEDDVVRLNIDAFQIATYNDSKIEMSNYTIKIANILVKLGKILGYLLFIISIFGYIYSVIRLIKKKSLECFEDFMMMTGCILSLFVCIFMIGIFGIDWLNSLNMTIFYGVGAYGFVYVYELYACVLIWKMIKDNCLKVNDSHSLLKDKDNRGI